MKTSSALTLLVMFLVGCGFVHDDENRDQALLGSDYITGYEEEVCTYPSVLTDAHFAVDLRNCAKIEGGQIGVPHTLDVNGGVTIDGWQNKDGEREYIGFEVTGDVVVVVKAGTHLYEAGAGTWVHPNGITGRKVHGISFVAFCEPQGEPMCTPRNPKEPNLGEPTGSTKDPTDPSTTTPKDPTDDGGTDGPTDGPTDGGTTCSSVCGEGGTCGNDQACYNGCCLDIFL